MTTLGAPLMILEAGHHGLDSATVRPMTPPKASPAGVLMVICASRNGPGACFGTQHVFFKPGRELWRKRRPNAKRRRRGFRRRSRSNRDQDLAGAVSATFMAAAAMSAALMAATATVSATFMAAAAMLTTAM